MPHSDKDKNKEGDKSDRDMSDKSGDITISSDKLPEIKDWKKGEKYEITLQVKQVSETEGDDSKAKFAIKSASGKSMEKEEEDTKEAKSKDKKSEDNLVKEIYG